MRSLRIQKRKISFGSRAVARLGQRNAHFPVDMSHKLTATTIKLQQEQKQHHGSEQFFGQSSLFDPVTISSMASVVVRNQDGDFGRRSQLRFLSTFHGMRWASATAAAGAAK